MACWRIFAVIAMSQADRRELVENIRKSKMNVEDLLHGGPNPQTMSLVEQGGSFTTTLLKRACLEAGHDLNDPGTVDEYWFADEDMILIDLSTDK